MSDDLPKRLISLHRHLDEEGWYVHANTVALAMDEVSKKGRGRPATGFDKTAYMKEYMRKRRAALKKPHE